jgi:NADPH2:quinone reductase
MDLEEETMRLTEGQGVSVVYDGVAGPHFEQNLQVLQARGYLVVFGQAGGAPPPLDVSRLSGITGVRNQGSLFVTYASAGDYLRSATELRTSAETVFSAILRGDLRLQIAEVFRLEEAAQAHRLLESGATSGKVLLQVA